MRGNEMMVTGNVTWSLYELLKNVSEIASLTLPILSVASFAIYFIVNLDKVKEFWKRTFKRK